jgi:hypothetical protein
MENDLLLIEQSRIVAYLDGLYPGGHLRRAKVASLRQLQSATEEELSALLPSVLDRVFLERCK